MPTIEWHTCYHTIQLPAAHLEAVQDRGAHAHVWQCAIRVWLQPCLKHTQPTRMDKLLVVLALHGVCAALCDKHCTLSELCLLTQTRAAAEKPGRKCTGVPNVFQHVSSHAVLLPLPPPHFHPTDPKTNTCTCTHLRQELLHFIHQLELGHRRLPLALQLHIKLSRHLHLGNLVVHVMLQDTSHQSATIRSEMQSDEKCGSWPDPIQERQPSSSSRMWCVLTQVRQNHSSITAWAAPQPAERTCIIAHKTHAISP